MKANAHNGGGPLPVSIDLLVEAGDWSDERALGALVARAVEMSILVGCFRLEPGSELSVVFTDDAHIAELNADYRGKPKPTNVLSFPASRPGAERFGPLLGDIVLARETILREAAEHETALDDYLTHLVVHGLLHLLGHDHVKDDEAERMEGLETAILARLGIADPYAVPAD